MNRWQTAVLAIALVAIFAGVTLVRSEAGNDVAAQAQETSRVLAEQSRAGCRRGVADRKGLRALNEDLAVFASGAAERRRAEGNMRTARIYESVVRRSRARSKDLEMRLPPALDCETAFTQGRP